MNRRKSREIAMKLLFSINLNEDSIENAIRNYKISEVEDLKEVDLDYVSEVLKGIEEKKNEIDEQIEKNLRKWKLNRLSGTSLAILRIAVYEIQNVEDVPAKVAINEALELAKKYCEVKTKDLINGVLNNFI